jgi:hypothetical protein
MGFIEYDRYQLRVESDRLLRFRSNWHVSRCNPMKWPSFRPHQQKETREIQVEEAQLISLTHTRRAHNRRSEEVNRWHCKAVTNVKKWKKVTKKRPPLRRSRGGARQNNGRIQFAEQVEGESRRLRTDVSPCNDLQPNPTFICMIMRGLPKVSMKKKKRWIAGAARLIYFPISIFLRSAHLVR